MNLVSKRTSFVDNSEIDLFHYCMFHGVVEEPKTKHRSSSRPVATIDRGRVPKVRLNTYRDVPIRQPRLDWIVADGVASVISKVQGVSLETCEIAGTISVPFAEGDFSHWSNPALRGYVSDDPAKIYYSSDFLCPSSCNRRVYKVSCRRLREVATKDAISGSRAVSGKQVGLSDEETLYLSDEIWNVSKLYTYGAAYVVHDELLDDLRPFLPIPYYIIEQICFA